MKIVNYIILLALLPCKALSKNLIEYMEFKGDVLEKQVMYQYDENGNLSSTIENWFTWYLPDSTGYYIFLHEYHVDVKENSIDSIEICYNLAVPEESRDTTEYVKIYNKNGTIQSYKETHIHDGVPEIKYHVIYDETGRSHENVVGYFVGNHGSVYYDYDTKNRLISTKNIQETDTAVIIYDNSVQYSEDGRHSKNIKTKSVNGIIVERDTLSEIQYDRRGRKIIEEYGKLINSKSVYSHRIRTTYHYGLKNRLRKELSYQRFYNTEFKKVDKSKYSYHRSLLTKKVNIEYSDNQKNKSKTIYKYDFNNKLLLEETHFWQNYAGKQQFRKVWIYD